MRKLSKKKAIAAAAIACCLALGGGATWAYFADDATAHNVVTSGGIGIQIIEKQATDGGALVDFPKEGVSGVIPGASVSKIVSVRNTDSGEAWVRVSIGQAIAGEGGEALPTAIGGELTGDGAVKGGTPVLSFDLGEGWQLGDDGWYYYAKPVAGGGVTDTLFSQVRFSELMGNEYQGCTANIIVEAQAVQAANNGKSALEAKGWPGGGSGGGEGGQPAAAEGNE